MSGSGSKKIDNDSALNRPAPRLTPIIEVHGWQHQKKSHDYTDFTKSAEWSHSVKMPWGGASIELCFPADMFEHFQYNEEQAEIISGTKNVDRMPFRLAQSMPFPGDFLIIREPSSKKAMWWGVIDTCSFSHMIVENGLVKTAHFSIQAVNWLSKLADCHVVAALGLQEGRDYGSLISGDTVQDFLAAIEGAAAKDPADGLTQMWQFVRGFKIPESMGGKFASGSPLKAGSELPQSAYLCHQIPVVANRSRASFFARGRIVEQVPGSGNLNALGTFASLISHETSLLNFMTSSFAVNDDLVEFFPSLEYPGDGAGFGDEEIQGINLVAAQEKSQVSGNAPVLGTDGFESSSEDADYTFQEVRTTYTGHKPKSFKDRLPFPYAIPENVYADQNKADSISALLAPVLGSNNDVSFKEKFKSQFKSALRGVDSVSGMASDVLGKMGPDRFAFEHLSWVRDLPESFVSPLGNNLRANPVLIYRMAPLRSLGINDITKDAGVTFNTDLFGHDHITWFSDETKNQMTSDLKYKGKFRDPHYFISADEVISISAVRDDSHRYNAFTIDPAYGSGSALRFWSSAGLPFFDFDSIQKHGSKIYTVEWPFLPRKESEEHEGAILDYMRTITAHAFHCLVRRRDQMSGTLNIAYRPDIKHGEPISVELDKSNSLAFEGIFAQRENSAVPPHLGYPTPNTSTRPKNDSFKAKSNIDMRRLLTSPMSQLGKATEEIGDALSKGLKNAPIKPEQFAKKSAASPRISAYVENVRHSVKVLADGQVKFRTSLDYNFGVHDPQTRNVGIKEI